MKFGKVASIIVLIRNIILVAFSLSRWEDAPGGSRRDIYKNGSRSLRSKRLFGGGDEGQ